MHSGLQDERKYVSWHKKIPMYFRPFYILLLFVFIISGCTSDGNSPKSSGWISPEAGTGFNLGEKVKLEISLADPAIDSIVYYADGVRLLKSADQKAVSIATDTLPLGLRSLTAKIYKAGTDPEEVSTNIVLKSTLIPKKYTYKIVKEFNHDVSSFTQGLEYLNGFLYESDGGNTEETGHSSLRKVEISSGRVIQKTDLDPAIFAEGITIIDDKILQLTYRENIGLLYDLKTLKLIKQFNTQYPREGWGLCFDGKRIYNSDGTNSIYFLNKDTFNQEGSIEVYDQNGPVSQLNELEYIDGMIYANIWQTDRIVIINPRNGQVTAEIDMTGLFPSRNPEADVLNGIAWDAKGKRLFVTGKKWAKLFQVTIVPSTGDARP
ncbi:glutaminyl-peptide cyclotransferase [Daejeonella oryzae]|uniref:glutaminyl-peptide cyclotransferase n=1 Tax=Daejeonella oryzae TaxID=1122943 RepID=UPI000409242B|nr:glutaminyl-peptide cyclotransferase [Daejeonella oryzae]